MLTWDRGSRPMEMRRVEMASRPDLLEAFRKTLGLFTAGEEEELGSSDGTAAEYIEMLRDCPVYELAGGVDFDQASQACLRFLTEGRME